MTATRGLGRPRSFEHTSESLFLSRRRFLQSLAVVTSGAAILGCHVGVGTSDSQLTLASTIPSTAPPYPFARNARFTLDRALTDPLVAARHNNFYEFSEVKDRVWKRTEKFRTEGWSIEVTGLVSKPQKFMVDDLVRTMPMEERLYRHRCVEAWSMAVPWSGFPLARLLERVEPKANAKYVRFVSFYRPEQAPGLRDTDWYPWPYFEAIRLDEAMNELTMLVTGVYGHALPKQHGAPIRLVIPWKYGYKSAKSIVKIELTEKRPSTFWNTVQPDEYSWESNVNPDLPHPRWSQARETLIGPNEVRPTLMYNGYGEWVGELY